MSMYRQVVAVLTCMATLSPARADVGTPMLGVPVDASEIEAADLTVMPNGENLPPGSGDAGAGKLVFDKYCIACHGVDGTGGINDVLVGGLGSLTSKTPLQTIGSYWPYATTVFDYVRRAMPYDAPGSLSNDEVYAVAAFLLHRNGIVGAGDKMDAVTLPKVHMPNRDNFDWAYKVNGR